MKLKSLIFAVAVVLATGVLTMPVVKANNFGGPGTAGSGESPPPPAACKKPNCECGGLGGAPGGGGPSGPDGRSSEPISYFNGSESLELVDLVVTGEFPISVVRKYDSQTRYDGAVGAGWALMLERSVYEYPDGSVILRNSCGRRNRYVPSGGSFTPTGGTRGELIAIGGGYELRYPNGAADFFDNLGRLTSVRDARGNRHEYTYDSRGKLPLIGTAKASVDPTQPITVAYINRITRIDERAASGTLTGRFVTFQYNETTGRLSSITADDGRAVSYVQDTSGLLTKGNLIQVNMLDGQVATYGYTDSIDPHNLTSIIETTGRTPIINTYDAQDRVIRQTEGARTIEFNYQTPYVRTIVTRTIVDDAGLNPYTAVTTYEFNGTGSITKIITPLGHEHRYTYSPVDELTKHETWQKVGATLSLQKTVQWSYDAAGRNLSEFVTLDSGETITKTMTYDHDWVASTQVVSTAVPGKIFRTEQMFNYGADGRPINIQSQRRRKDDGSFLVSLFTYDSRNRILTTTLPDGVKAVHEYTGDFVSRRYFEVAGTAIPQGDLRFEHDSEGRLTKSWDARGNLTQFAYDDRGRLISQSNALGEQELWTYSGDRIFQHERGRTVANGEGQVTKYLYDARGRITQLQRKNDAGSFVTLESVAFDSEDRQVKKTDATGRVLRYAYDLNGNVSAVTDAASKVTQFFYDASGNRVGVRNALGQDVTYEFDDLDRLTAIVAKAVTPNARTEFTHDAMGSVTSVRDPENRTTSYGFDALSRKVSVTLPLGQQTEYVYDDRNRVDHVITARGQKLDYNYEPWGPLREERQLPTVSSSTPDRTISYTRDLDGNVTAITDSGIQAGASASATYDVLGRLHDETVHYLPGGNRVLQHRYDRFGNRNLLSVTGGGAFANSLTVDKLNRLTAATLGGSSLTMTHYANDMPQTLSLPGGVSRSFTFKLNGPVDTINVTGPSGSIAQFSYSYDDVLNVDTMTDTDGVHDYTYDSLNRLTQATHPVPSGLPATESYTYTPAGNRKNLSNPSSWSFDSNHRIGASPGLTYGYDAAGNLESRSDAQAFTHDARQRLVQLVKGGVTSTYLHDPNGRRIRKSVAGVTTWYLWDGGRLIAEFDASGNRIKRYGYLGSPVPAVVEDANGSYVVHPDSTGMPRLLTNATAQVVWRSRVEAFGKAIVQGDPDGNSVGVEFNFRFAGQYFDSETGTHYNFFRDYDPDIGRYQNADPIGLLGGINPYAYAAGNPLSNSDPLGLAIYRGPGNNYSDIPPSGPGCEVAVRQGDYIVDWEPCVFCFERDYGGGFGGAKGPSDDVGESKWGGGNDGDGNGNGDDNGGDRGGTGGDGPGGSGCNASGFSESMGDYMLGGGAIGGIVTGAASIYLYANPARRGAAMAGRLMGGKKGEFLDALAGEPILGYWGAGARGFMLGTPFGAAAGGLLAPDTCRRGEPPPPPYLLN